MGGRDEILLSPGLFSPHQGRQKKTDPNFTIFLRSWLQKGQQRNRDRDKFEDHAKRCCYTLVNLHSWLEIGPFEDVFPR